MDMFVEYYSSVVERCSVAGVSLPQCVQTFKIYAGTTNSATIVTNGATVYTNLNTWVVYDNITRTNQLSSFVYTSTNGLGVTTTNKPFLTAEMIDTVDDKLVALFGGRFLQYWRADTNDSFESYFAMTNTSLPALSLETAANYLGVGFATNPPVGPDIIYTTYRPLLTSTWSMAELRSKTNGWIFHNLKSVGGVLNITNKPKPVLRYYPAGTNAFTSAVLTIFGTDENGDTNQTVVLTSTNDTALAYSFTAISSITCSNQPSNTGDVFAVTYATNFAIFARAVFTADSIPTPRRFYAENYFERIQLVNVLRWYRPDDAWYAEKTLTGPASEQYCTDQDTFDGVCAYSNFCYEGSEFTTNLIMVDSRQGAAAYVFGYVESLQELNCTNDAFIANASAYLSAKCRWRGQAAGALNTTNFSFIYDAYIQKEGLVCYVGYGGYLSGGGDAIPSAWTNADPYFVSFGSGAGTVIYTGSIYAITDDFFEDQNETLNTICITNTADLYEGPTVSYGCGLGGHCSLVGSTTNSYFLGDSFWYEIVTTAPVLISVLKYDVPGGFTYVTTDAP